MDWDNFDPDADLDFTKPSKPAVKPATASPPAKDRDAKNTPIEVSFADISFDAPSTKSVTAISSTKCATPLCFEVAPCVVAMWSLRGPYVVPYSP